MTTPRTRSEPKSTPRHILSRSKGTPFSITPVVGAQKSVLLSEWWLTKKKDGLGVEGLEWKAGSAVRRLFSSGTISKRIDSSTLETSDGVTVSITGPINTCPSLQNGFSLEVCNTFLFGFPYNWKRYIEQPIPVESEKKHFGISFDDIPVTSLQDLLLTSSSRFKTDILDHVVDSLRDFACPSAQKCAGESLVPRVVVGVKTRGMLKRKQDDEASIGERVHTTSRKRRNKKKKVYNIYSRRTTAKEKFDELRNKFEKPESDDHDVSIKTAEEEDVVVQESM